MTTAPPVKNPIPKKLRWVLAILAAIVALVSVPAGALFLTFAGNAHIVDGASVAGGATAVKDGYVGAFLVPVGGTKVALVDAGADVNAGAIDAALKKKGLSRNDVVAILITHGHGDHVAGCAAFPNAAVYAGRAELPLLDGSTGAKGPLTRWMAPHPSGCARPVGVDDGAAVAVGDFEARAYALPGHTAGSTAWLLTGTLFLGDGADASAEGELSGAKWIFSDDHAQARHSLVTLHDRLVADHRLVTALAMSHTGFLEGVAPLRRFAESHR
jgi:glyoxylase-like metal-dependent hydrolase (beta-lactamase superfamily II)